MSVLHNLKTLAKTIPLGSRDDWAQYFMSIAYMVSLRSTCGSRRVGAVLVDGLQSGKRRIVATGYNGYPPGAAHCIDGGCPRFEAKQKGLLSSGEYTNDYPCDAFHAEANALFQIMNSPLSSKDGVMFTTTFPCQSCARKMNGAQIKTVYYCEGYPDPKSSEYLQRYGIRSIKLETEGILKEVAELCGKIEIGSRDKWEEYFMSLAYMASLRSKSATERNGAILITNLETKRIIATGYNGYPVSDFPDHLKEKNHPEDMFTGTENVLNQIKISQTTSRDSVLFTTLYPTFDIAVELNGAGIKKVYYHEGEEDQTTESYFRRYGIDIKKV